DGVKIWRVRPGIREARVEGKMEQFWAAGGVVAIQHEVAPVGLPFGAQMRVEHPMAVEAFADRGAVRINATALPGHRMTTPRSGRLLDLVDSGVLAAHHARAARPSGHDGWRYCGFHRKGLAGRWLR